MAGSAIDVDAADKKIQRCGEGEDDFRAGGGNFGLDISEASGGEKGADAIANLIAVEGLAGFLRKHGEEMSGVWNGGEFDGFYGASDIRGHGGERGLRFLIGRSSGGRSGVSGGSEREYY